MLEKLSLWIKRVILVVMFSTFIEFLIPDSKFSKYIRVVLGTIVMITILNPIISIINKGNSMDVINFFDNNTYENKSLVTDAERFAQKNDEMIIDNFKKNINLVIREQLNAITSFEVLEVKVSLTENTCKPNFGQIDHIVIVLAEEKHTYNTSEEIKIKVKKTKSIINDDNILQTRESELQKVREYLNIQYEIPLENIHIRMEG